MLRNQWLVYDENHAATHAFSGETASEYGIAAGETGECERSPRIARERDSGKSPVIQPAI